MQRVYARKGDGRLLLKVGRGRGTWGLGTRGSGDAGTRGLKDVGTRGLGEVGREDVGTRRRVGIRGRDKQITPDFCAELVKYNFLRSSVK